MVIEYLQQIKDSYFEQKHGLEKQLNLLEIQLKENIGMIKMLEETNDSCYELFTPRNVNSKNKAKINELMEEQKTINEFINQEVLLTVLKGKIELTLSNKPTTSKITLQRVSNNCYSTTDGNITINLELEKKNFVQTKYKLIEYGGTDDKFFSLHMTLDKQ